MDDLTHYGWTPEYSQKWASVAQEGLQPARVVADFGTSLKIALPAVQAAELSGKLAHYSNRENIPKVGDWVAVRLLDNSPAVIEYILPRHNEIARKVAGKRTTKQVIAANVDIAFVLLALDDDFSVERLKRFLYQLTIQSIEAIIVLNKADKTERLTHYTDQLQTFNLPIIVTTALHGTGVDTLLEQIKPGKTAILLGSSGVGKSTMTNQLLGRDVQDVQAVRVSDSTGKHTTVHRELFVLSNGGLLIDTPGIRELQLWGTEDDLEENFDDIAALASQCKYVSCSHDGEDGCAIQKALHDGTLDKTHYASYLKMKGELGELKAKKDVRKRFENKKSRKALAGQRKDALKQLREDTSEF